MYRETKKNGKNLQLTWICNVPQEAATVAAHRLPELSELSHQEDFTNLLCHPVKYSYTFEDNL